MSCIQPFFVKKKCCRFVFPVTCTSSWQTSSQYTCSVPFRTGSCIFLDLIMLCHERNLCRGTGYLCGWMLRRRVCPFLWSWMRRERSGVDQCYWVWREAEHSFTAGMLYLRLVQRPYTCHQTSEKVVCRPAETLAQYSLPLTWGLWHHK
jgi:hypothetical protein